MKNILIIEDDEMVAGIYRTRFQTFGYQVEVATTGEAALKLLQTFRPDLVQTDLTLPGMSGLDVIRKIRGDSQLGAIPIVVFTNGYLADLVTEAWKAGATKVLTKADCTPKLMLEVVERILQTPLAPAHPKSVTGVTPISTERDHEFEEGLKKSFSAKVSRETVMLLTLQRALAKGYGHDAQAQALGDLRRKMRTLAGSAALAGYVHIARLASALEALLKTMSEDPKALTTSSQRTVAQGTDKLIALMGHLGGRNSSDTPVALIVDDDEVSRKVCTFALDKIGLKSLSLEAPMDALNLLAENRFDLILLDIDLPGISGFDLIKKIRELPQHRKTPVIFVTALSDFENRARSVLTGGVDLVGKPFPMLELGVKALVHVHNT